MQKNRIIRMVEELRNAFGQRRGGAGAVALAAAACLVLCVAVLPAADGGGVPDGEIPPEQADDISHEPFVKPASDPVVYHSAPASRLPC